MIFFDIHTHNLTKKVNSITIYNQYPNLFQNNVSHYSIGIHPWYIQENRIANDLIVIESKLQNPYCLALGECGLDKRIAIPLPLQLSVLEAQLQLAQRYQKPVIIHCVAAYQEIIAISKKLKLTIPLILHGFSKNEKTAQLLLEHGFYLSFGKHLLSNPSLTKVFNAISNSRIFLETDTFQETIETLYSIAAKSKNISIHELQNIIQQNFHHVFTLPNSNTH